MEHRYHKQILQAIDDILITNADTLPRLVYKYLGKLRSGGFDAGFVDTVVQKHTRHAEYDIYDAFIFSQIWHDLHSGRMSYFRINLGSLPTADANTNDLDVALRGLSGKRVSQVRPDNPERVQLDCLISGSFIGQLGPADGKLEWTGVIPVTTYNADGNTRIENVPEKSIPIEVGWTASTTTANHLISRQALARWPYYSKWIHVLYCNTYWSLYGNTSEMLRDLHLAS